MKEIMYDHSSVLIVGLLFAALVIATEAGFRMGLRYVARTNDSAKGQVNTIQTSLLGVLALILAFTFSLSLQRYDSRSQAIVAEANAIGTAMLRAELLPDAVRARTRQSLQSYLDLRIRSGAIPLNRDAERRDLLSESGRVLDTLWQLGVEAAAADASPVRTGLYIQALNEMIDALGTRDAALARHVPEAVLFLLFGTFVLTACLVGYAAGLAGHRASFATYILIALITFLVFVVIDLDRPRRGLIEVSQQSLVELQATIRPDR